VYVLRRGAPEVPYEILSTTLLATILSVNAFYIAGAYTKHITSGFTVQVVRTTQIWSLVFAALLVLGYLTKTSDIFSRIWAVGWYFVVLAALAGVRFASVAQIHRWRRQGRLARTVAIVDLAGTGDAMARRILRNHLAEARLVGVFSESPGRSGLDDLISLSRLFRIDDVLIAVSGTGTANIGAVLRQLGTIPTNVRLCPVLPELGAIPVRDATVFLDTPALTVHRRPLGGWSSVLKRIEDLVLATAMLVAAAPAMAVIAVLIKLDSPGPVLFRQPRLGFNNNEFLVYKFRTMTHRPEPEADVPQARRDDPRVTRIGRILRRTSLDELPQLFNVLLGNMSLVGPRPHAVAHNQQYAGLIDDYLGRHRVQPGITGWAQVNGYRGETDTLEKMRRRVEYDLAYIDNWSILLDIKIIFLTALSVISDPNAY
jgi:putative colanic acid biosynthesis UDP-glucose lipid carrier transferase